MANVTDAAFRRIIAKYGKPDVMWTEFVSCEGLCSDRGRIKLLPDLWYDPTERPIVAQIFGSKPDQFYETAQFVKELGFDGVDINMGCPDRSINQQGSGVELMRDPSLASKIIRETIRGAHPLPVSVKTRIGYHRIEIDEWLPRLLDEDVSAITLHLRTRKELSGVLAHWEVIPHAVEIADRQCGSSRPMIIGNGDVATLAQAHERAHINGVDGIMIGRGIFGNPWLFNQSRTSEPSMRERLEVLGEHVALFDELLGTVKPFEIMKKHFKAYIGGFDGAKELRVQFMDCKTPSDVEKVFHSLSFE